MKIGIIGAGNVGGTLGTRWAKNGHNVFFSSRDPQSDQMRALLAQAGPSAKAGAVAEAVNSSDVLLIATPWPATESALRAVGEFSGKILIDATNPLLPDLSGIALDRQTSGGEQVAQWARGAKVVKAFNTVGFNIMANPEFDGSKAAMLYCGDDSQAKQTVAGLIGELGFQALDAGPLTQSRVLEPFALLWISLALKYGYGRDFAFQMLRRAEQ
jgi:8-hydroxy-5-deazaflavin:NADPH oxidoreductase